METLSGLNSAVTAIVVEYCLHPWEAFIYDTAMDPTTPKAVKKLATSSSLMDSATEAAGHEWTDGIRLLCRKHPEVRQYIRVIIAAAKTGNLEIIKLLDHNSTGSAEAIKFAAKRGHLPAMKLLRFQAGDWPHTDTEVDIALAWAVGNSKWEAAELCLQMGATNLRRAFTMAAYIGNCDGLGYCELRGWTTKAWYFVASCDAAAGGHTKVLEWLKIRGFKHFNSAFTEAAHAGHIAILEQIKSWMNRGGAPKARTINTAFVRAASAGRVAALTLLREWGATDLGSALLEAKDAKTRELLVAWGAS